MTERRETTPLATPVPARASWRWSTWSIGRRLPVLTAAIIVLVVVTSLGLTYDALKRARVEAMQDRLRRLARQLVATSDETVRARFVLDRQVASDSAVVAALRSARNGAPARGVDRAVANALLRLRAAPDSSLPIELWTSDGRRILHVGADVHGDSLNGLRPELRTRSGKPLSELTTAAHSDSVQVGAFYASGGRVFFWTIVPVLDDGVPLGFIAQQRTYHNTPQSAETIKELLGNDVSLYLHNTTDPFWSTYIGEPTSPVTGVDTTTGDYIGVRRGVGDVIAYEARVHGTPWVIDLEAPLSGVLAEPRATVRRLSLFSFVVALAGVGAAWLASRRITSPLISLASVSEAIARGDYATRMPEGHNRASRDEVARLTATFNRMAAEIERSHRALEQQVTQARAVSQELEATNQRLVQLSADAEEARDAAEEANRAKGDFLAVMSHELRTPLNAIGGYADILKMGIYGEVTSQQRDALDRITRSQQMLLSLINDVLNFAKVDAGQVQYRMSDVRLHDELSTVEALVAPQLRTKHIEYRFEECADSAVVRADPDKLHQIVLNLLSNAIKFTPQNGRITLSYGVDGSRALIRVTDTGVGIAPDRIDSIFDPFVQVDRALHRPYEGVGLGLAISRDLAEGMGGKLTVKSEPGRGSTFTLTLERVRAGPS